MACNFAYPWGVVCCFDCNKECEDRCLGMPKEYKECEYYFEGNYERCMNDNGDVEVIE